MQINKIKKNILLCGLFFLFTAVMLGAFGAHGLAKIASEKQISTFQTGVTYQFYHAFSLLILALLSFHLEIRIKIVTFFYILGIIFFSFNCYLYAITGIKLFGILVPIGGTAFIIGHLIFLAEVLKQKVNHAT
jgi:uncharacterized membrane protein YgdD (TMEM256/DUF423 family)